MKLGGNALHLGGEFSFIRPGPIESVLVLVLMFLSMTLNFGFLLMTIDRLRKEVADLTVMATEKVTRKTLTQEDQRRLVEEALSELDFSALASEAERN